MAAKRNCLVLFLLIAAVTSAAPSAKNPGGRSSGFVCKSCAVTLYPDLCCNSLSRFATTVNKDPVKLATAASNVSLAQVRSVLSHVASLSRVSSASGTATREAAGLRDCTEALGNAVDLAQQSTEELRMLKEAEGPEIAWRVSNAQTWMSAAITNENTCVDGFKEVGASPVKADVCARVGRAEKYTSNALALINNLVARANEFY